MIRKGQVRNISGNDIRAQADSSPDYSRWPPETSSHPLEDDPRSTLNLCNRTFPSGVTGFAQMRSDLTGFPSCRRLVLLSSRFETLGPVAAAP